MQQKYGKCIKTAFYSLDFNHVDEFCTPLIYVSGNKFICILACLQPKHTNDYKITN